MVFNGIFFFCDSFVMVLEFSVMFYCFFSAELPNYFYIMHFKSLKKKNIYILYIYIVLILLWLWIKPEPETWKRRVGFVFILFYFWRRIADVFSQA